MDVGIRQAGFEVLGCVEFDKFACESLRANILRAQASTRVYEVDIRQLAPERLAENLSLIPGELDLLFGGPPCQSFSLAGKRLGLKDPRGPLLFEIIRFARFFLPKVILLEQVKGLLSAKAEKNVKGEVFSTLLSQLESEGYTSKGRVLRAVEFGVPQLRERLFVVATRDHNAFSFPNRTHASIEECGELFGIRPFETVGTALLGLGEPSHKIKGKTSYSGTDSHVDVTPDRDRERIAQVPEGSNLAAQSHLGENLRCGLTAKDTTKYLRTHRNKPANTLRCGEIFYHPVLNRYLTPREYMRIHGFPDDYVLCGPIRSRTGTVKNLDQHRQVANSVPPPLARKLGEIIRKYIDDQNL